MTVDHVNTNGRGEKDIQFNVLGVMNTGHNRKNGNVDEKLMPIEWAYYSGHITKLIIGIIVGAVL